MLSIAIVTETYAPEINGVAMTMARLVAYLRERGHRVQLVRPSRPGLSPAEDMELRVSGLAVPGYPDMRFGLPACASLFRAWRAQRPDLVHIVTEGPLGYAALSVARALGIPTTSGFHTRFDQYSRHYGIGLLQGVIGGYLRHFHNHTHCTFAPSRQTWQSLVEQGYSNVVQLDRGVDAQLFTPARRSSSLRAAWGVAEHTPVALYVGRIAAEKNLPLLLRAFERFRAKHPDARLVIVGEGPARPALQRAQPGLIFAGPRTGEDLAAHYASADLFLFPSLSETWGNVVVEAMASGLPVVAFDYAAPAQLIRHGENGFVARCGDEEAFLAVVDQLPTLAALRELGACARARCEGMSWELIGAAMEREFLRLTHRPTLQEAA